VILVDTSVLVDFVRGREEPGALGLRRVCEEGVPFAIPAICCQELLQGAANEREWRLLDRYLGSQGIVGPRDPWTTHREAARIFHDARRQGLTVRSTVDCLVAQLALEGDHILLHADRDYEVIARVRPLRQIRTWPA